MKYMLMGMRSLECRPSRWVELVCRSMVSKTNGAQCSFFSQLFQMIDSLPQLVIYTLILSLNSTLCLLYRLKIKFSDLNLVGIAIPEQMTVDGGKEVGEMLRFHAHLRYACCSYFKKEVVTVYCILVLLKHLKSARQLTSSFVASIIPQQKVSGIGFEKTVAILYFHIWEGKWNI